MKLNQLRTFAAIAEEGSFAAAARVLGIAQPAVSKQVAHLEQELGASLFVRAPDGVRLTQAGEAFLAEARNILEMNDLALASTRAAANVERTELHLGHAEMLPVHESRVASVAVELAGREPRLDVVSHRMSSAEQWRALDARRIQVGVGYGEPEGFPRVAREHIACISASAVLLSAAHPLAGASRVSFRDLAGLPLLLFPREVNPPLHDLVLAGLRERGLTPVLRGGMHTHAAREEAVRAGHGWMLAIDGLTP
ncbi:MAG TPA: LysR family transcriptional regulator, partial [Longimicrobium sp.]